MLSVCKGVVAVKKIKWEEGDLEKVVKIGRINSIPSDVSLSLPPLYSITLIRITHISKWIEPHLEMSRNELNHGSELAFN